MFRRKTNLSVAMTTLAMLTVSNPAGTSPTLTRGNLQGGLASSCDVGMSSGSIRRQCALSFRTGSASNGYTLHSVTARFQAGEGTPSGFNIALYADSDDNGKPDATALATLSGDAPSATASSVRTYTCSGNGCELDANEDYFIAMSTPDTTGTSKYFTWRATDSDDETQIPSTNGWSIGNTMKLGVNWGSTSNASGRMKVAATVNPVPTLTASSIGTTGATLTIGNHTGSWYYKADTGPDASACSTEQTGTSKTLSSLTPGTTYTYTAYGDSGCTPANKLATAAAFTTTGVSVSNLSQSIVNYCAVGGANIWSQRCANAFTTGSNSGGYTLHSVTAKFRAKAGNPGTFSVALHADSSGNPASSAIANASFSGSAPETAGDHTYTCSGAGCTLSASTTYHIVMSATANSGTNQFRWETTTSGSETNTPSGSGWSIANTGKRGNVNSATWLGLTSPTQSTLFKVAATVN